MSFTDEQPMDECGNYICDGCGEPVIPAHGDGPQEQGVVFVPDRRTVKPRSHMACVMTALGGWLIWLARIGL